MEPQETSICMQVSQENAQEFLSSNVEKDINSNYQETSNYSSNAPVEASEDLNMLFQEMIERMGDSFRDELQKFVQEFLDELAAAPQE